MAGTWAIKELEVGGKKISDEENKNAKVRLDIQGDKYTVHFGDMQVGAGTLKLNAAKNPRQIDIAIKEGMGKDQILYGIYKFDGETMIVCVNQPDAKERPTEFKTKEGSGQMLFSYKRIKN